MCEASFGKPFFYFAGCVKIFGHHTSGGLFSSKDDAMTKNPDNPSAKLFSILSKLEKYRDGDGNFQFKLCYPGLVKCNEWIQTSNPATETNITGFKAITLTFETNGYKGGEWAGLGKNISWGTLIDDTPSQVNWHCAIGARAYWPNKPKIPGPAGQIPNGITDVELFVLK